MPDTYDSELPTTSVFDDWREAIPWLLSGVDQTFNRTDAWEDYDAGERFVEDLFRFLVSITDIQLGEVGDMARVLGVARYQGSDPINVPTADFALLHSDLQLTFTNTTNNVLIFYTVYVSANSANSLGHTAYIDIEKNGTRIGATNYGLEQASSTRDIVSGVAWFDLATTENTLKFFMKAAASGCTALNMPGLRITLAALEV